MRCAVVKGSFERSCNLPSPGLVLSLAVGLESKYHLRYCSPVDWSHFNQFHLRVLQEDLSLLLPPPGRMTSRKLSRHLAFQYLKGAYGKDGDNLFSKACCDRTRSNGFKLREGRFSLDIRKMVFYNEGGETLAQVAQRGSGGPIPGNTQGQIGWGSEQPGLVEDVPAHCRGIGLDDL